MTTKTGNSTSVRIVVPERNPAECKAIADILRKCGYAVEEFDGGQEIAVDRESQPKPADSADATTVHEHSSFVNSVTRAMQHAQSLNEFAAVFSIAIQHEPFQNSTIEGTRGQFDAFEASVETEVLAIARNFINTCSTAGKNCDIHIEWTGRARFSLVAGGFAKVADIMSMANKLNERFSTPFIISGRELQLAPSIGIATFPSNTNIDEAGLIERAEIASFCVSHQADRTPQLYTDAMSRWSAQRRELERSLRGAVERNELIVYYQPRVETATRKILGMEALVRWLHPTLGMIPPMQFIPIAEETGLILNIGEWVLREACRQCKAWRDAGLPAIRVGVNLSAVQFRNAKLFETVSGILNDTKLPADGLELELTESILMEDPKGAIQTMEKLRAAGIHLSIDDFGTGYSSLSYLKRIPVDAVKIDQSFIRNVTSSPEDAAITTTILVLGHSLGLTVIAEGVETESQLAFLEVLKCDEVQGFLFGRPAPAIQAEALLGNGPLQPKH
ncbi:MAG: putative bifunctional diguanylate cyclase/phosphodiesterase [Planctomycetota bacterium]